MKNRIFAGLAAGVTLATLAGPALAAPDSSAFTGADYYDPIISIVDTQRASYGFELVGPVDVTLPSDSFDANLLNQLNAYRADNDLEPVQESEALRAATAIQVNKNLTGPGADNFQSTDIDALCGIGSSFGENTAVSAGKTAAEVFDFWVIDGSADLLTDNMTAAAATVVTGDGRQQSFLWVTDSTNCIAHPGPSVEPEVGPAPTVKARSFGRVIGFDVNPDREKVNYFVTIEKKQGDSWSVVKTTHTHGCRDFGAVVVPGSGQYRVVVPTQFDAAEGVSNTVTVRRWPHR